MLFLIPKPKDNLLSSLLPKTIPPLKANILLEKYFSNPAIKSVLFILEIISSTKLDVLGEYEKPALKVFSTVSVSIKPTLGEFIFCITKPRLYLDSGL